MNTGESGPPPAKQEALPASGPVDTAPATKSPVRAPLPDAAPAAQPAQPAANADEPSAGGSVAGSVVSSAIEAASEPGEEDEFEPVDGYETSNASTSADSNIYAHTFENGRRYHYFKNSRYPLPDDDMEQSREDMKHSMMMELTDGRLFFAPVEQPQEVLDIGTGTGIWAVEVGDRYPGAHVRGIDMSPIQPLWVPPNVDFLVDDCQNEWLARNVDLVHFRFMVVVLKDVPRVMGHAFRSLRPGGWLELQEMYIDPLCDDGTMPADDPIKYVYKLAHEAFTKFELDIRIARHMEPILRAAGFTNIRCVAKKVPIGVWAKDKTLRLVGLYQKTAVAEILGAIAGRPFAALGIPEVERAVIVAHARRALEDTSVHRYFTYYFWSAQKPPDAPA